MSKLSHDILLALAYVGQISDPDLVRSRFIESLNGLDEAFAFEHVDRLPAEVPEFRILPIATLRSAFGYAVMTEGPETAEAERAVFRTAFQFLAVLLENRLQARALKSRNESLLKEIKEEKSLVHTVLDTLPVGVWVTDRNGTILMGNAAGENIWAGIRYVGIDRYCEYKAWRPDTGKRIESEEWAIARAIKTGETIIDEEIDIECFDGTHRTILNSAAPLLDDDRRVLGAICVNQDITERKRAEKALRQSEEQFRAMFETASIGMAQADVHTGQWLRVNDRLCAITGYAAEELFRLRLSEITYPEDRERDWEAFERVVRGDAPDYRMEKRYVRKDGTLVWVNVNMTVIRDADGQPLRTMATIEDISDRKRLEQERIELEAQLRQQQKLEAIGTLASGVAHEINNPIAGIMNYAQLIVDKVEPKSQAAEYAGEIVHETERVATIVRNLLQFARQETQTHSPARLADIVGQTLSLLRAVLRRDQITLTVDVPADLPLLTCRSQQLQQVLMNLLTNARDALNERYPGYHADKTIQVRVRPFETGGRRWLRITVADQGNGIPAAVRERIFDPFFTTKPRDQGTGLGLSISHGIVKDHHGVLHFETEMGVGTRFHMDLPVDNGWTVEEG
jgi:PAS domain S-box-containing protein